MNFHHVVLVGLSGSGKSTIGPRLARRLDLLFIDTAQTWRENTSITVKIYFRPSLWALYGFISIRSAHHFWLQYSAVNGRLITYVRGLLSW